MKINMENLIIGDLSLLKGYFSLLTDFKLQKVVAT